VETTISVARLGPGDLEACVELDSIAMSGFWSEAQWRGELGGSRRYVLAARPQEPMIRLVPDVCLGIACGWLVLDELHITLVMVRPPWRRRGIARHLLSTLLDEAAREGADNATLEVAAGNASALALYEQIGFCEAGRRHSYYSTGDDALILWRRLGISAGSVRHDASRTDTHPS